MQAALNDQFSQHTETRTKREKLALVHKEWGQSAKGPNLRAQHPNNNSAILTQHTVTCPWSHKRAHASVSLLLPKLPVHAPGDSNRSMPLLKWCSPSRSLECIWTQNQRGRQRAHNRNAQFWKCTHLVAAEKRLPRLEWSQNVWIESCSRHVRELRLHAFAD